MAITRYCTAQMAVDLIGGATPLRLDAPESPELSTASINKRIENVAGEIDSSVGGFTRLTADDGSALWLVLEMITAEIVSAQLILLRMGLIEPAFLGMAKVQLNIALRQLQAFKSNKLRQLWLASPPLITDPLCVADDVTGETPGLTITTTSRPKKSIVDRLILRKSAHVRAIAALFGYDTDPDTISAEQAGIYRDLVATPVSGFVLRYNSTCQYGPALDNTVNEIFKRSEANLIKLATGQYRQLRG